MAIARTDWEWQMKAGLPTRGVGGAERGEARALARRRRRVGLVTRPGLLGPGLLGPGLLGPGLLGPGLSGLAPLPVWFTGRGAVVGVGGPERSQQAAPGGSRRAGRPVPENQPRLGGWPGPRASTRLRQLLELAELSDSAGPSGLSDSADRAGLGPARLGPVRPRSAGRTGWPGGAVPPARRGCAGLAGPAGPQRVAGRRTAARSGDGWAVLAGGYRRPARHARAPGLHARHAASTRPWPAWPRPPSPSCPSSRSFPARHRAERSERPVRDQAIAGYRAPDPGTTAVEGAGSPPGPSPAISPAAAIRQA